MKEEVKAILAGLLQKSKEGNVVWVHASSVNRLQNNYEEEIIERGTIEPDAEDYAVSTSSYTINIFRSPYFEDDTSPAGFRINILNEFGEIVTSELVQEDELIYAVVKELITLAREYVFGEARILKLIRENLSKPGIFGSTDDNASS